MDKNPLQGKGLGLTDQTELMETTYAAKIHVSNNTCTTWTQFFFFSTFSVGESYSQGPL